MYTTRIIIVALLCLLSTSCLDDDHRNIEGRTKVRYSLNGNDFEGNKESDFYNINDIDETRELFIFSIDTTATNRLDIKLTIPRRGTGTYDFSGSLEETNAYLFLSTRDANFQIKEFYSPFDNTVSGTVTTVINNSNHIRGSFNVLLRDIENVEPDVQISQGYFDIRY